MVAVFSKQKRKMVSAIKYQTLKKILRRHYKNRYKPMFNWEGDNLCHLGMKLKDTDTKYKVSFQKKKSDIIIEVVKYA